MIKTIIATGILLALAPAAIAGPYVRGEVEVKGADGDYGRTKSQARLGYEYTELESTVPYVEVGGGAITQEAYDAAVAAKDAAEAALVGMYSPSEFQELRAGSTVIAVSAGEATINLQLEESSDLSSWIDLGDAVPFTVTLDPSDDTQFFRVKLAD